VRNPVAENKTCGCMHAGEIIQMSAAMNLIFEVQDLAVASPATVSRCGMMYVEPSQTGWRPLCTAWMAHRLPDSITPEQRERLLQLFEWLVDPCVAFVRKHCK
jgi:dynein heavy chain